MFEKIDKTGWLILGIVGVVVLYEVVSSIEGGGSSALGQALGIPNATDTTGNPNSIGDTSQAAYANQGVFGWLGNIFNQASGGLLQSAGNAIGGGVASLTGC